MPEIPLVSIIVPIYNRAHMVARSIGCLTAQSYKNLEIIIVDDSSWDDIQNALAALNDIRIKLIRLPKNGGAAAARNVGIAEAKGDFIAFHDSDDMCVFDKIERQMKELTSLSEDYIGVYTSVLIHTHVTTQNYYRAKVKILPSPGVTPLSGDMHRRTVQGNTMNLPTMLLRKAALQEIGGFDERLRNNEDWDITLRLTRIGKFHFIPEPYYIVSDPLSRAERAGHISNSLKKSAQSFSIITGKLRRQGECSPALARGYFATASFLMRLGRSRSARLYLKAAIGILPFQPRYLALYLFSFVPRIYAVLRCLKQRGKPEALN